jgi:uncharacterized protein YbjT (DUF2867 family)
VKIAVAGGTGRVGRHVVDVLTERGHEAVPMSRTTGVNVFTGSGLAEALSGVEGIIDAVGGVPEGMDDAAAQDKEAAAVFFTTAARNMQQAGERAGVRLAVVVSIIGIDKLTTGHPAAKLDHERAWLAGPIPVRIMRSAPFHELVLQMIEWGRQGDVAYVPTMRMQPVAPRNVAEAVVDLATVGDDGPAPGSIVEIAGPRVENLVDLATMLAAKRGDPVKVEGVSDPSNPDTALYESDAVLAGPDAFIAGPSFAEWLETSPAHDRQPGRVMDPWPDDAAQRRRDVEGTA